MPAIGKAYRFPVRKEIGLRSEPLPDLGPVILLDLIRVRSRDFGTWRQVPGGAIFISIATTPFHMMWL